MSESYLVARGGLDEALFPEEPSVMEGPDLNRLFKDNVYYLILQIEGISKGEAIDIETYEEFQESKCEVVVLAVDAQYIQIYAKEQKRLN